ncbi:hypothetical protein BH10ACI1_BH10ACI1_10870 [soil metagenome]
MRPQKRKIERHHALELYGIWLLGELQRQGISLSVIGENGLKVKGEMTAEQKENVRLWKRALIEALSPKCSNCGLPMQLIKNDSLWFCPFGCCSISVELSNQNQNMTRI